MPVKNRAMRFLVSAGELGLLMFGLIASVPLGGYVGLVSQCFDWRAGTAFLAGVSATLVSFLFLRRRTRGWKIAYDADAWILTGRDSVKNPVRTRYKRIAKRIALWVPSVIAASVLLFFPAATHLRHPGPRRLGAYRILIPWSIAIVPIPQVPLERSVLAFALTGVPGKVGITRFWKRDVFSSAMSFEDVEFDVAGFRNRLDEEARLRATAVFRRDLQLNGVAIECWQYRPHRTISYAGSSWRVDCHMPAGRRQQHFYAWFHGREEDLAVFFQIVQTVTSVD